MNKFAQLVVITIILAVVNQCAAKKDSTLRIRIKTYSRISKKLSRLNNKELDDRLKQSQFIQAGCGEVSLLTIDGVTVVAKKIPLTDLERKPENVFSTANLFDLPLFFQYKIGTDGFGVWRELAVNRMTTNWVLSGECPHFAMMYHYRVLETVQPKPMNAKELKELDKLVHYWDNSAAVKNRLEALHNASAYVVLFLEYIPHRLHVWLEDQLKLGGVAAQSAVSAIDEQLKSTIDFMNSHGLIHFDTHFGNILTDGTMLYFMDFGLSVSSHFRLTPAEIEFLTLHRNYDWCVAIEDFVETIQEYVNGGGKVAPSIMAKITQYAPITSTINEFFEKLKNETKSAPYPADTLDILCAAIDEREKESVIAYK